MIEISGKIIKGEQYGRILGFPTANLDRREYVRKKMNVKFGVWAGWASYQLKAVSYKLQAAIIIGPIDKSDLPKIEAHLIGFSGNLYGKKVIITLQKYIRQFKKYKNVEVLKKQIAKDIKVVKKLKF